MAVYTHLEHTEIEALLTAWELAPLKLALGIAEGVENSNYLIETEDNRYILTIYEKRVQVNDLPFFLQLKQHLAAKGIACPVPVIRKDGALFGACDGKQCALVTFLPGHSVRRPDALQVYAVGKAMAQMHVAAHDFPLKRANDLALSGWQDIAGTMGDASLNEIAPTLAALVKDELAYQAQATYDALPGGVIHADLFPDNVFFDAQGLSGIIDFYFACNDAWVYEIAICLNCWCFEPDGSFNATKAKRLLQGYQEVRPLGDDEKHALPDMARGAALRFLLTRAWDWVHTPEDALVTRHDPMEYAAKLGFHQQVKSAGEYGI